MEESISIHSIADAIEDNVRGTSPRYSMEEIVRVKYSGNQEFINSAIHCLNHFLADEDIWLDDSEYDYQLKSKLSSYVEKFGTLRMGLDTVLGVKTTKLGPF